MGAFAALIVAIALLAGFSGTASAASVIGKDGKIHGCYRAKGKSKGSLRVVRGKHCKHGEKKIAWGTSGANGPSGSNGTNGSQGTPGTNGTSASDAALEAKIAGLTVKVEGLENLLQGVAPGNLSGVIGKLNGITGLQLTEAVNSVPIVSSLCSQVSTVTGGVNALRTAIPLISILGGVGLSLDTSGLPALLSTYTCPS